MTTVVLTRPNNVGIPGTIITDVEIPAGNTVVVDSTLFDENLSLKWIYTLKDPVAEEVVTAEVVANHNFGNDPRWNRYGIVGDPMPHLVDVQLVGTSPAGTLELRITNNHPTNTYTANVVRIQVLS